MLDALESSPLYKMGQFLFDLTEWEDFMVDGFMEGLQPAGERVVGHLSGPLKKSDGDRESPVANFIADAQLAATKAPARGAADRSSDGWIERGWAEAWANAGLAASDSGNCHLE